MKLSYNLNLEQSQKLIMTPELRQAIELLQFNSMELKEYITNELEENPMLEFKESTSDSLDNPEQDKKEEVDWKEYIEKQNDNSYSPQQVDKNPEDYNYESFVTDTPTLNDHLMFQLGISKISLEDHKIGEYIIQHIDDNGYLQISLEEISNNKNIKMVKLEEILNIIQKFEPLGVGARNLKECLLIQIREEKELDPNIEKIIENYLDDLGHNRIQKISKELDIDLNRVQEICDYIKKLEPKPGRSFSGNMDEIRYITPDAAIQHIEGEFKVVLNDIAGPRLNINDYYKRLMKADNDDKTTEFLNNRFNRALWVIRSIEQRRDTIRKVIESILKFQMDFFLEGEKSLKPLTLKDIAEDIEMHESTVSRTTNGKYVQTPRGLFELKYFFSSGLEGRDGEMSSTSIKSIIKDIIDNEDSKKPYSDQKLSDLLKIKDINISRRTVAKYRDELNIPASSMRKRF